MKTALLSVSIALFAVSGSTAWAGHGHGGKGPRICSTTANVLHSACQLEAADDFQVATAVCLNLGDRDEYRECLRETRQANRETIRECREVREARKEVCDAIGEGAYTPEFGPEFADNFVHPDDIGHSVAPNPYRPLVVGSEHVYEQNVIDEEGDEEIETITVTVTDKTKLIDGIVCRVVRDTVYFDDELIEDTDDWLAQDKQGNVWYCGEEVKDYESFDGDEPQLPELVDTDGSFKAGRDGDKAGILMPAQPHIGLTFREEASWNNAEDVSEVVSLTGNETAPAASCNGACVVLRAFNPMEPGVNEFKSFAPGIGEVVNVHEESGERAVLVRYRIGQ